MSWLTDVLAGRREPGLYSWSSPVDTAEILREVEDAGWRFVLLETPAVDDKRGLLVEAARAFGFPGHFGHNWDALADSLSDVRSDMGVLVLWEGSRRFAAADEDGFATALDVFRERAESRVGGPLVVLVREE